MTENLTTIEIKAFVPAKDFDLSKRFYRDVGFDLAWSDDQLAYFRHGRSSFLLQNFYDETHAANFMMHLLVETWTLGGLTSRPRVSSQPMTSEPSRLRTGHGGCAISFSSIRPASCGGSVRP